MPTRKQHTALTWPDFYSWWLNTTLLVLFSFPPNDSQAHRGLLAQEQKLQSHTPPFISAESHLNPAHNSLELGLEYEALTSPLPEMRCYSQGFSHSLLITSFPFAQICTHTHIGGTPQGSESSTSNNADDPRADWGSGTGHRESRCVIKTHEVPITVLWRGPSVVPILILDFRPNTAGTELNGSRMCIQNVIPIPNGICKA